jgi:hypothetical protein
MHYVLSSGYDILWFTYHSQFLLYFTWFYGCRLGSNINDRKYIGDYLVFFGHKMILWKLNKQRTVVRSSIEAKCKALIDDTTEVI